MSGPLGRNQPSDWEHVAKYPLLGLEPEARPVHVPVVAGINWYDNFDSPVQDKDGNYWIGQFTSRLGSIRGGHCICFEPVPDPSVKGKEQDNSVWWPFYDQGQEGSCVGHGVSRTMSLLNRQRYDALWLYHEAQRIGGYEGQEGAAVRDGLEVLRSEGHRVAHGDVTTSLRSYDKVSPKEGINAYRWADNVGEVAAALGLPPSVEYVTILNSWGKSWPERVRLPFATLERLIHEAGEMGVVTDR
jgi:hypothetical protein